MIVNVNENGKNNFVRMILDTRNSQLYISLLLEEQLSESLFHSLPNGGKDGGRGSQA